MFLSVLSFWSFARSLVRPKSKVPPEIAHKIGSTRSSILFDKERKGQKESGDFPKIWKFYETSRDSYWVPGEIKLDKDLRDFNQLEPRERKFLKMILAFFTFADGIVADNLLKRFLVEVENFETLCFYTSQSDIEIIHSTVYNDIVKVLIPDVQEQRELEEWSSKSEVVSRKKKWCENWVDSKAPFVERLIAFAIIEGVFFSGSFAAIFRLKQKGICTGLCTANDFISRDEALHYDFACFLFNEFFQEERPSKARIEEMVKEAVTIERDFFKEALPENLLGMSAASMSQYIEFIADRLLLTLGYDPIYRMENPFPFMNNIALESKSNMFEKVVSEYSRGYKNEDAETGTVNEWEEIERESIVIDWT